MTSGKFLPGCLYPSDGTAPVQPQCFACPPAHVPGYVGAASVSLLPTEMYDLAFLYQILGNTLKVDILVSLQYFRPLGTAVPVMLIRGQCKGISICPRQKIIYLS